MYKMKYLFAFALTLVLASCGTGGSSAPGASSSSSTAGTSSSSSTAGISSSSSTLGTSSSSSSKDRKITKSEAAKLLLDSNAKTNAVSFAYPTKFDLKITKSSSGYSSESQNSSSLIATTYDSVDKYFHVSLTGSLEAWYYVKDDAFISASSIVSEGTVTKVYTSGAASEWETGKAISTGESYYANSNQFIASAYTVIADPVEESSSSSNAGVTNITKESYLSTGDGNLTMSLSGSYTDESGAQEDITIELLMDNYLLVKGTTTMTSNGASDKTEIVYDWDKATITYPNLDEFTLAAD